MSISLNLSPSAEAVLREPWGQNLDCAAVAALAVEGYRSGRLSAAEVGRLLGPEDRWAVNQWLADRQVPLNCTLDDLEADRATLDHLLGTDC